MNRLLIAAAGAFVVASVIAAEILAPVILRNEAIMSIVMSDVFGEFVLIGAFVVIGMPISIAVALFAPARPSGRTGSGDRK